MMQWQMEYTQYHMGNPEVFQNFKKFFTNVISPMAQYQIPVIELGNDVPKEAVCQVFENVNQGGVSLTVFELVTATFAADNFELRKDWDSIWNELRHNKLISFKGYNSFTGTDFITAITLLSSYLESKTGSGKAVSCKKKDVLRLTYNEYQTNRNRLIKGLKEALKFIQEQRIFTAIDLPYTSQLIPLSVAFAADENVWFNQANRRKLEQWYWCGVFGELYGSANETRYVTDIQGLFGWVNDDSQKPDTVLRSNFHASRLLRLYTRNSAAYKGVMALILKNHARDFLSNKEMDFTFYLDDPTDIHHIFPQSYCIKQGISNLLWNSVINKTPICARTNRIIGGNAPSQYLSSLERNHDVNRDDLNGILTTHLIDVDAIRSDNFEVYFESRRQGLLDLIEKATGKPVSGRDDEPEELSDEEKAELDTIDD
jgi:hypothetical protein